MEEPIFLGGACLAWRSPSERGKNFAPSPYTKNHRNIFWRFLLRETIYTKPTATEAKKVKKLKGNTPSYQETFQSNYNRE